MNTHTIGRWEYPVAFKRWLRWADCPLSPDLDWPGVYVLAVFAGNAPVSVDLESADICYIGSAYERTLSWELQQFKYRCPVSLEPGGCEHTEVGTASNRCRLWVAVFPICDLEEPWRSAFIRHVERELIWKWVSRHGRMPDCNMK